MKLSRLAPVLALLAMTASAQVSLPYSETFSSALGPEWALSSSAADGRIILGQNGSTSPLSGGDGLIMDSSTSGGSNVTNEARLAVDLSTGANIVLQYYFKETSDENDAADGVFLTDGLNTIQLNNHNNLSSTWTLFTIDITTEAANAGLTLTSNMELIFSQSDNFPAPTDGAFFDDITVQNLAGGGQANTANASLNFVGGYQSTLGEAGPFGAMDDSLRFTVTGEPNQRYLLLLGDLQVGALVLPPLGSLDLDTTTIVVALDGNSPGFLNSLAQLDATGESNLTFGTGALPPGLFTTFQAAVFNSGPSVVEFTAAYEFYVK